MDCIFYETKVPLLEDTDYDNSNTVIEIGSAEARAEREMVDSGPTHPLCIRDIVVGHIMPNFKETDYIAFISTCKSFHKIYLKKEVWDAFRNNDFVFIRQMAAAAVERSKEPQNILKAYNELGSYKYKYNPEANEFIERIQVNLLKRVANDPGALIAQGTDAQELYTLLKTRMSDILENHPLAQQTRDTIENIVNFWDQTPKLQLAACTLLLVGTNICLRLIFSSYLSYSPGFAVLNALGDFFITGSLLFLVSSIILKSFDYKYNPRLTIGVIFVVYFIATLFITPFHTAHS